MSHPLKKIRNHYSKPNKLKLVDLVQKNIILTYKLRKNYSNCCFQLII